MAFAAFFAADESVATALSAASRPSPPRPRARLPNPWLLLLLVLLLGLMVPAGASGPARNAKPGPGAPARAGDARSHVDLGRWPLAQRAGALAQALGRPRRLLVGVGTTDTATVLGQGLAPDIYDQYINGVGSDSWLSWNSPPGAYVDLVLQHADMVGAIPMFTLYQMAARGDGNISGLGDPAFMGAYWRQVHLLFERLGRYGRPVLVNFEPDFWGYAQRAQPDPQRHPALVRVNPDCAELPDTVAGVAACLLRSARLLAPQAYVGFPPSMFVDLLPGDVAYMQKLGADQADFVVIQTLDRDAGCMEAQYRPAGCVRNGRHWYWDEGQGGAAPNFSQHLAQARRYFEGLQRPLLWWQTPLGVPAAAASQGPPWRDNRVRYFLTHPAELVAAGGVGVVFSPGERSQTTLRTDGGQFKTLSKAYLAQPAALP